VKVGSWIGIKLSPRESANFSSLFPLLSVTLEWKFSTCALKSPRITIGSRELSPLILSLSSVKKAFLVCFVSQDTGAYHSISCISSTCDCVNLEFRVGLVIFCGTWLILLNVSFLIYIAVPPLWDER
jgi:hypothetical protein